MKKIQDYRFITQLLCTILLSISAFLNFKIVALIILVSTILSGVFFCGWICPFGFVQDTMDHIGTAFGINYFNFKNDILENTDIAINQSKYFITETISNVEKNHEFISDQYSIKKTESLKYFQNEYIKNKDDLSKIDLQKMKE